MRKRAEASSVAAQPGRCAQRWQCRQRPRGRRRRSRRERRAGYGRESALACRLLGAHWGKAWPTSTDCCGYPLGVEAIVMSPELLRAVIDVLVRDPKDFELDASASFGEELADRRAESARDDVLF